MSGPELGAPGTKLCPSCARFVPQSDGMCGYCGFNFDTGAASASQSQSGPILADQTTPPPMSRFQNRASFPRRSFSGFPMGVIVMVLFVLPFVGVLLFATDVLENVQEGFDVNIPDINVPDVNVPDVNIPDINLPDSGPQEGGTAKSCTRDVMKHLRRLLAKDGQGSRPINDLFNKASEDLGPLSAEYRILVRGFAQNQGNAITNGTAPALKDAGRQVEKECKKAYS
jgi:hypothetical protein